ncbi:MAG: dienelactone hydrolase family protein [Rhodoferax sp.]|jgi:carboxymethylenebutenolidase|nr:dienelactone hydrolase family protein [Rhodoferax sp.]
MSETIQLNAADGFRFPTYVARPGGPVRGAVVVVQEIFGVNAHIRAVADDYAAAGYLALAPDAFHRVQPGVELGYTPEDIQAGIALKARVEALPAPGVLPDLQAAVDHAATGGVKVAMVGYCWGGLLTWRSACLLRGLSAAAPYYGGGMTVGIEPARQPQCPVLCHFGAQDHAIALDTVEAFRRAQPAVEVQVYDAQHGFNCDHRGSYDAAAAALARERTLAFFARHLA